MKGKRLKGTFTRNGLLRLKCLILIKTVKRVGSGGATLEVLKYLHEQEESFDGLRILVIHSGGDSKVVKIIQSYTGVIDKMVWRKY